MPRSLRASFRVAALAAAAVAALALAIPPVAAGGPGQSIRPSPRPDPQADWRAERQDREAARRGFERGRTEDWLDRQWAPGGTLDDWLKERREAERALRAESRKDWLERRQPRRDGDVGALGERLDDQWRRQRERHEESGAHRPSPVPRPPLPR